MLIFLLLNACRFLAGASGLDSQFYSFTGIQGITYQSDGTFLLKWNPIAEDGTRYFVFAKKDGQNYDYRLEAALGESSSSFFNTPFLTFNKTICFNVRFYSQSLSILDNNTYEKCWTHFDYPFQGIDDLKKTEAGEALLTWTPMTEQGVTYQVFETKTSGTYDFTYPLAHTDKSFWITPFAPIDQVRCYNVRAQFNNAQDTNLKEKCTSVLDITPFKGIESATSPATGSVLVSWTAAKTADVKGYRIYQGSQFETLIANVDATTTSFTMYALPVGASLSYGIRAYDSYGNEDGNTSTLKVTVGNFKPPQFAGIVSAVNSGTADALITWNPAYEPVKEYRIFAASFEGGSDIPTNIIDYFDFNNPYATTPDGNQSTLRLTNIGDDLTHVFLVRAVNFSQIMDTNTVTASVTIQNLGAPTFGGPTSATLVGGKVQINWAKPVGQVSQFILTPVPAILGSPYTFSARDGQGKIKTQFTISASPAGSQNYTFTLKAKDRYGNIDTNIRTVTLNTGDVTPPAPPNILSAIGVEESQIRILVQNNIETDFSKYNVYRSTATGNIALSASSTRIGTQTQLLITGLNAKQNYKLGVSSVDTVGNESQIIFTDAKTLDTTSPDFTGITSFDINSSDPNYLRLNWKHSASTDIKSYYIFLGTNTDLYTQNLSISGVLPPGVTLFKVQKPWSPPQANPSIGNNISFSGTDWVLDLGNNLSAAIGSTYYAQIFAVDDQFNSTGSSQFFKTIPSLSYPLSPSPFNAVWNSSLDSVNVTWTDVPGVAQYRIYRNTLGDNQFTLVGLVPSGQTSYLDNLSDQSHDLKRYRYRVASQNSSSLGGQWSTNTDFTGYVTIPDRNAPYQDGIPGVSLNSSTGNIDITWSGALDPSGIKQYLISCRVDGQIYNPIIVSGSATLASLTQCQTGVNSLSFALNKTYDFLIQADDILGNRTLGIWTPTINYRDPTLPIVTVSVPTPSPAISNQVVSFNISSNKNNVTYNVTDGTVSLASGTMALANTITPLTFNTTQLSQQTSGNKTITVTIIDSFGNTSVPVTQSLQLNLLPPATVTGTKLTKDLSTKSYVLSWTNPVGILPNDTIMIRKNLSNTPPSSSTSGNYVTSVASNSQTVSIPTALETINNISFSLFVCNEYGMCSSSANSVVWTQDGTFFNDSEGTTMSLGYTLNPGGGIVRVASALTKSLISTWDGTATAPAGVTVQVVGASPYNESWVSNLTYPFWFRTYYRVSIERTVDSNFVLSPIYAHGKVPSGMVFVPADLWPQNVSVSGAIPAITESYSASTPFDFAIDKYEVKDQANVSGVSGTFGSGYTTYPNANNVVLQSANGMPDYGSWYAAKQGCLNRGYDPLASNYVSTTDLLMGAKGTTPAPNPYRKVHLSTGLEWFIGAYNTNNIGGATNCNIDARGAPLSASDGVNSTVNCRSDFGVRNAIGNLWEWTDDLVLNGVRGAVEVGSGTGGRYPTASAWMMTKTDNTLNTGKWDFTSALRISESSQVLDGRWFSLKQSFATNEGGSGGIGFSAYRGGDFTGYSGRFSVNFSRSPVGLFTNVGARCALQGPRVKPISVRFASESTGGNAQLFWSFLYAEDTTTFKLGKSTTYTDVSTWDGITNVGGLTISTASPNFGGSCSAAYTPGINNVYSGKYCDAIATPTYYRVCATNPSVIGVNDLLTALGRTTCSPVLYYDPGITDPSLNALASGATVQDDSEGDFLRTYWNAQTSNAYETRLITSNDRTSVLQWNGDSENYNSATDSGITVRETSTLIPNCSNAAYDGQTGQLITYSPDPRVTTTGYSCMSLGSLPQWSKRFYKLAIANKDANGIYGQWVFSSTKAAGRVPPGMVMIAREDWPNVSGTENYTGFPVCHAGALNQYPRLTLPAHVMTTTGCRYDFALDKYIPYLDSGSIRTTYSTELNMYTDLTANSINQTATLWSSQNRFLTGTNFFGNKRACDLRTSSLGIHYTDISPIAYRRIRMLTPVEYRLGRYGTPIGTGNNYCSVDSLNSVSLIQTGTQPSCISRFGVYDMVGAKVFADMVNTPAGSRTNTNWRQFYGTAHSTNIQTQTAAIPAAFATGAALQAANTGITGWTTLLGIPNGYGVSTAIGFANIQVGSFVGGEFYPLSLGADYADTTYQSFNFLIDVDATSTRYTRCALGAP